MIFSKENDTYKRLDTAMGFYDTEFMSMNSGEPLNSRRLDSLIANDNVEGVCRASLAIRACSMHGIVRPLSRLRDFAISYIVSFLFHKLPKFHGSSEVTMRNISTSNKNILNICQNLSNVLIEKNTLSKYVTKSFVREKYSNKN